MFLKDKIEKRYKAYGRTLKKNLWKKIAGKNYIFYWFQTSHFEPKKLLSVLDSTTFSDFLAKSNAIAINTYGINDPLG